MMFIFRLARFILLFSIFLLLFPSISIAQNDEVTISPTGSTASLTSFPNPSPTGIAYHLAYPGMLPDNPFYKLKVLRDKIIEKTIADPTKKIDFYILQADKGILAGGMLQEKGKNDLAKKTLLKAENNMTKLADFIKSTNRKLSKDEYEKIRKASLKHQEVLQRLIKRVGKDKKTYEQVLGFSRKNLSELETWFLRVK